MKRLDKIVEYLEGYQVACDVGSDHGYVLKKALDKRYIKRGIAIEIAKGPLSNTRNNLSDYPVTFYLSDGFDKLTEDFDVGIIAGMGAYTIVDILKRAPKKHYILQANDKVEVLREYLTNNDYTILDEDIAFEKHYYIILKVVPGYQKLSDEQIYLGPHLSMNKDARNYYLQRYNYLSKIIKQVDLETKVDLDKKIVMLKKVIE